MVGTIIAMVIKPFSLFKLSCTAALRGTLIVINTWVDILSASIYFHVSIFWRFVVWTISLITLPARAVAALHREKQLEANLDELQIRLDDLEWDRKELQDHIKMVVKEHEMMDLMLGELEEEHNQALGKIKVLETELHNLKDENLRLKEVHGKSQWDTAPQARAAYPHTQNPKNPKTANPKDGLSPWESTGVTLTDILMQKVPFYDEKSKLDAQDFLKTNPFIPRNEILGARRDVALSQSVFSALLSLVVGMIIWEADDPCMPLVTALFMVVGMSLKSVVGFFSTIENKPASDAVALLSLNWFILGTLTYPTLPRVARFFAPVLGDLLEHSLRRFLPFLVA